MGRIKTKLIKRITLELFEEHGDKFSEEYEKNKQKLTEFVDLPSKKMRNIIAGYLTRLVKNNKT
ncbi:30S ribosomal protein S17e [Candidatus Woesearchaeota archaeon]|nr:MAG: 30S ribosomal protein S17e [Candidatus Woesearchaeota archaeon]